MTELESRLLVALRFISLEGLPIDGPVPSRLSLADVPYFVLVAWVRRLDDGPDFSERFARALRALETEGYVTKARTTAAMLTGDVWTRRPDGLDVFITVNNELRLARSSAGNRDRAQQTEIMSAAEKWEGDGLPVWRLTAEGARLAGNGASTPEAPAGSAPPLLPEDIYIMKRLRDAKGVALFVTGLPSGGACLADPNNREAPSAKTIGNRLDYLKETGLVRLFDTHKPRKGWVLTDDGQKTLARITGN